MPLLRVAIAHLAPIAGDLPHNRRMVERAVTQSAKAGAEWIITPELVISGYSFVKLIGTDWILPQPDAWMTEFCARVRELGVTVFWDTPNAMHKRSDSTTRYL